MISLTDCPRYLSESPKSPLATFEIINQYCVYQGLSSPRFWVIRSISSGRAFGFICIVLTGLPGTAPAQEAWFDVPLGYAVAAFLFLAALDHLLMTVGPINRWYNGMIANERNDARWIEYSVSASLMIVLIAMISGVNDAGALLAIAGVNASMIFFGLLQEVFSRPSSGRVNWMPYIYGCFAGAVPWVVIALQIATAEEAGPGPPGFVYGIIVSLFILFNSFAVNMVLQYKRVGPWRDYVFGEKAYILLSLVAKSLLAWQVFANVLVGG